jgi:hypothetical protein
MCPRRLASWSRSRVFVVISSFSKGLNVNFLLWHSICGYCKKNLIWNAIFHFCFSMHNFNFNLRLCGMVLDTVIYIKT